MRILIIAPHESPIIQRLVLNLRERDHAVWLASYNAENKKDVINMGPLRNMFDYFRMDRICKIVEKIQPDVVHAHVVNHYGIMAWMQPKPLVVGLWGSDVMLAPNSGNFIKKNIFKVINKCVLKRAELCHTSAQHVALEADKQYHGALLKTKVFYWGLPLSQPSEDDAQRISEKLLKEFGLINQKKYIVFPRGLDEIYNPKTSIKIIKELKKLGINDEQIVVLKGFCADEKEEEFKRQINVRTITYIDRILKSEELYFLYSNTVAHVSIPSSDSLGGGVVEPSLLGSFPILSNLPSYREYALNNDSHVMNNFDDCEIKKAAIVIVEKTNRENKLTALNNYSADSVMSKIEKVYLEAMAIANKR